MVIRHFGYTQLNDVHRLNCYTMAKDPSDAAVFYWMTPLFKSDSNILFFSGARFAAGQNNDLFFWLYCDRH